MFQDHQPALDQESNNTTAERSSKNCCCFCCSGSCQELPSSLLTKMSVLSARAGPSLNSLNQKLSFSSPLIVGRAGD